MESTTWEWNLSNQTRAVDNNTTAHKNKKNMKAVQVVTEEQLETKLNQFNEIDLDDDDAVEEYLTELESYNGSVII